MGKLKFILASLLIITSCNELFNVDNVGKPVKFSTLPSTRTVYSSEYDGRIEWTNGDAVSIYMTWEGADYTGTPESAVYNVSLTDNNGRYSYGELSPVGESLRWHGYFRDGRAWEYVHNFYSAYPPTDFVDNMFQFYLPSNQDGINMNYAYMAAYANSSNRVNNDGGKVYLYYHPMFTTLCVTIHNDLSTPIGGELRLVTTETAITGDYFVSPNNGQFEFSKHGDRKYTIASRTINTIGSGETGETVMFFIIPREYINNDFRNELYFVFNNVVRPIPETIQPYYKYNITITATEVEVTGSRMTDTEAWFLLAILKNNGGGNNCWNDFENFWKNVYGFKDVNDFNNSGFWNKFNDSISKADFNEMGELLDEYFPGDLLDSLLTAMSKIEEINLGEGSLASTKKMPDILLSEDFSKMFPNVKTIKLMPQNDITYKFFGLKYLETITLDGGYAVNVTIVLQDCAEGVNINKGNNKTVTVEIINN